MEYLQEIAAQSFRGPAILANLSYILLIVAVLMSKVTLLRVLAVGSGITGFLYLWVFLGDRVASVWEALFILANLYRLAVDFYRERTAAPPFIRGEYRRSACWDANHVRRRDRPHSRLHSGGRG